MTPVELSVIIPTYNRVGPLRTTLRSVQRAIVRTLSADEYQRVFSNEA